MDKLKMHTPNKADDNFKKLAAMFPNAVTETINENGEVVRAIDKDVLMQEISCKVVDGNEERYQFTWPDKKKSVLLANAPINRTLRPVREDETVPTGADSEGEPYCSTGSVDFDTTENLYIEGDNLEVLKLLQETYLGKIKMIYIDPPYNTGNDFVYNDEFGIRSEEWNDTSGNYDADGNQIVGALEKNTEANGRFHTDWLNMIYPRLKLAKDLLTDDGMVLISIDDCEQDNLRRLCDEVFGRRNFVDTLIWKKRYGGGAKEKYFVSLHEYVLVYCRNIDSLNELFVPLSDESAERYYSKRDSKYATRGGYRTHPLEAGKAMDARPNLIYPIPAPDGTMIMPKKQWLWSKERVMEALKNDDIEIVMGKDGWVVSSKQYLREEDGSIRPAKMLSIIDDVYTQHGTNEMIQIMGNAKIFQYPKPSAFIKKLVSVVTENKDEYVMDFFSGSAATAHAVMQLNAEDGGHRKFIMVQLPEKCDEKSEAYKAGYKTICEIGKERIRRAGAKIKEEAGLAAQNLDTGFRVLKCDTSNMKDVYYNPAEYEVNMFSRLEDNIKEDRTPEDLLFQVMLDLGILLSSKIQVRSVEVGMRSYSYFDVEDISYNTIEGEYDSSIFTAEKATQSFDKAFLAKKAIQDYVFTDGSAEKSIERKFAEDLDAAEEVCVYAKLPRTFQIPTPVGNYSPDWAIAFYEGTVKHIFFVAETKGTMETLELRPIEQAKISCAKKLFNEMSTSHVVYHDVDSYQSLLNIMNSI